MSATSVTATCCLVPKQKISAGNAIGPKQARAADTDEWRDV